MSECRTCDPRRDASWFPALQQIAVIAPFTPYSEIRKMLFAMAEMLGHPDNISGLESFLLHLIMHENGWEDS